MIFIKLRQIPSVAHNVVSSLHQLAPHFPSQNLMVSNQLSFTFILLLQILINSVVFVFVFEDIVLIFVKVNQYTNQPIVLSVCSLGPERPRAFKVCNTLSNIVNIVLNTLSSGQCVISAASGEEVCPLPTTELTCPKEERIRVLMKKSEYFSKIWTTL